MDGYQDVVCKRCGRVLETVYRKGYHRILPTVKHKNLCSECFNKNRTNNKLGEGIQRTVCRRCGRTIYVNYLTELKRVLPSKKSKSLCYFCREEGLLERKRLAALSRKPLSDAKRKEFSDRMKQNNPMFKAETRNKVKETLKSRYANGELISKFSNREFQKECRDKSFMTEKGRKSLSDRMKQNNPMYDAKIRDKTSKTIRRKIETGELSYKSGPQHHLWKGNRTVAKYCRDKLYESWVKKVMERDNYRCTVCGNTGMLHVHHTYPFRDVLKTVLDKYGVLGTDVIEDFELLENISKEVVDFHSLDMGITVCPKCHGEIDSKYRRKRHEN